jgi:hypothetical protein
VSSSSEEAGFDAGGGVEVRCAVGGILTGTSGLILTVTEAVGPDHSSHI